MGARRCTRESDSSRTSKLESLGDLAWFQGTPTGVWKEHNTDISYWARVPAPPRNKVQTYADYFNNS